MKKLFLFISLLISQLAMAQNQEGVIDFEVKINLHKGLGKDQESMKSMIPEFRTSKNRLYFNPTESYFTNVDEEAEDVNTSVGGGGVQMRFNRPVMDIYKNLGNSQFVTLTDFAGKKFRIEDSLKTSAWKFVDETKKVAGYDCKKATFRNEEMKQDVVAWYTEALVCSSGPQNFWGLPGMILAVDVNDGSTIIEAKNVALQKLTNEVKIPTGGKKVTAKEFKKIRDDYMKEMGMPSGGGGNRIIIRN